MSIWSEPSVIDLGVVPDWRQAWDQDRVRLMTVSEQGRLALTGQGQSTRIATTGSAGQGYDPERHVYLGQVAAQPWFIALSEQPQPVGLREALGRLDGTGVAVAMRAAALAQFHASHRFCPRCGASTSAADLGRSRTCTGCATVEFPRFDPAIIVAITDNADRLLLGHHAGWDDGHYSVLAGFVEAGESLEQTLDREVAEEVGVHVTDIRYVGSQPWPLPRSLMVGFTARALTHTLIPDGAEIVAARWISRAELADELAAAVISLPPASSIARALISRWYGTGW